MTCKEFAGQIAAYLSGEGSLAERRGLQDHAAACEACRRELEEVDEMWNRLGVLEEERPGPELRQRFYAMLETQTAAEPPAPLFLSRFRLTPLRARLAAGLALFALGLSSGLWLRRGPAPAGRTGTDVQQLRSEVDGLRRTLAATLLNQDSASDRLKGVYLIGAAAGDDAQTTRSLLNVLDSDPNLNLRLSAIDSLAPRAGQPDVRAGLLAALERQNSPLVQVALVNALAQTPDRDTARRLRQMAADPRLQPDVRRHVQSVVQTSI